MDFKKLDAIVEEARTLTHAELVILAKEIAVLKSKANAD